MLGGELHAVRSMPFLTMCVGRVQEVFGEDSLLRAIELPWNPYCSPTARAQGTIWAELHPEDVKDAGKSQTFILLEITFPRC